MIRCPFTREAVLQMLPIFRDDAHIARRVSNHAYAISEAQVRQLRNQRRRA
ncbi:hypothetical protein [Sphingobium yanoikuyae]|mgnify:CR=1 FL=1|uniref:hypothetical protein n=1 Tax=Sphingobium yanoikuyae TaxID=13690 RepID=UPI00242E8BA8|nr:hypothetical protein [Sphingobium yanoikuyae]